MVGKPVFKGGKVGVLNQGAGTITKPTHKYQSASLEELMFAPESGLPENHCREDKFVGRMITTWVD